MKAPKHASTVGSGNRAITFLVVLLVLFIGLGGAVALYVTNQSAHEKQYLTIASEQQLLSQRMATYALEAASGKQAAFLQLRRLRDSFDQSLARLREGDPQTGMPPLPVELNADLERVGRHWSEYRQGIDAILNGRDVISSVADHVRVIQEVMPQLLALSDEVVGLLIKSEAPQQQIYVASRQLMIAQRIENNLNRVMSGTETSATAADRFGRDAALFGRVLDGLAKGSAALEVEAIKDPEARNKLREVAVMYAELRQNAGAILDVSPALFEVNNAASGVEEQGGRMLEDTAALENSILEFGARLELLTAVAYGLGLVSILVLIAIGWTLVKATRRRLEETAEQNRRNQQAILRLLDEMTTLAEGDLTVHATVTEDITGAIADSVNYSIDALRSLVTTINQTAEHVASSAEKTATVTQRLTDASNYQAREIASVSAAVVDMADSIENVSKNAETSADVARQSVDIAHEGASAVSRTIDGMGTIREQIQETSKRIKRLGESSQEIGDIVSLINEIADQTNILALNAAIQASTAGEAGRGFAVVADEVQRLAERASNATKQIEALVKTIQTDTNEAVISMEQSTANVVAGARLAEDAGGSLTKIQSVSSDLATLIQTISQAARQQASAASNVTNTMNVIQEITLQTSEGTNETATSVGELTTLASELRQSVSGFKLPESEDIDSIMGEQTDEVMEAMAAPQQQAQLS